MCPPPSQRPSGQFAALPSAQRGPLKTMSEEVCLSLLLGTRPCTCLWEMAQSLWHSLRHQEAGLGYLVLTYSHCLPEQGSFPGWWGSRRFFQSWRSHAGELGARWGDMSAEGPCSWIFTPLSPTKFHTHPGLGLPQTRLLPGPQ